MDLQQIKSTRSVKLWLGIILVVAFIIRISFMTYAPLRGWDETVYLNLGKQLSTAPLHYSLLESGWNDYIPTNEPIYSSPNIGFRAPLLPYALALLYFLNLSFLINFLVPIFATASVYLIFKLGRDLFNERVGLYAAALFALVPLHAYFSGRVLTDTFVVFFILLTANSFWQGFERGRPKHKVLFGFTLALALLARYTTLWIAPIFVIYILMRDKSLKILKDKYLWLSISVFLLTLLPWFVYGNVYYQNILGGFIHGFKAAHYWGGRQSAWFFFTQWWSMFSAVGIIFVGALVYVLREKRFKQPEIIFLLIWSVVFLILAMQMPHKEERFILPLLPAITMLSGYGLANLRRHKRSIVVIVFMVLAYSNGSWIYAKYENAHAVDNACFARGNNFLARQEEGEDSVVVTNQSPIVYYYTEKENILYPDPWSLQTLVETLDTKFAGRERYVFFANYDIPADSPIKKDLDRTLEKVFECQEGWGYSAVYKY